MTTPKEQQEPERRELHCTTCGRTALEIAPTGDWSNVDCDLCGARPQAANTLTTPEPSPDNAALVTDAMVKAAQEAYEGDIEYGINDEDMSAAIEAALTASPHQSGDGELADALNIMHTAFAGYADSDAKKEAVELAREALSTVREPVGDVVEDSSMDTTYLEQSEFGRVSYHGDPSNDEAREYYELWQGALKRANRWRGIASAMGYEPNAHNNVKPREQWLLDRIEKYRRQAALASAPSRKSVLEEAAKVAEEHEPTLNEEGDIITAEGEAKAASEIAAAIRSRINTSKDQDNG